MLLCFNTIKLSLYSQSWNTSCQACIEKKSQQHLHSFILFFFCHLCSQPVKKKRLHLLTLAALVAPPICTSGMYFKCNSGCTYTPYETRGGRGQTLMHSPFTPLCFTVIKQKKSCEVSHPGYNGVEAVAPHSASQTVKI